MLGVAEHELERMLAGRQFKPRLGLTCAKMKVVLVLRDRLARIEWFIDVDKQMMMAAVLIVVARMGDAHVAQTKSTPEATLDDCAVLRPDKIEQGVLARRLALRMSETRERYEQQGQRDQPDSSHRPTPPQQSR